MRLPKGNGQMALANTACLARPMSVSLPCQSTIWSLYNVEATAFKTPLPPKRSPTCLAVTKFLIPQLKAYRTGRIPAQHHQLRCRLLLQRLGSPRESRTSRGRKYLNREPDDSPLDFYLESLFRLPFYYFDQFKTSQIAISKWEVPVISDQRSSHSFCIGS